MIFLPGHASAAPFRTRGSFSKTVVEPRGTWWGHLGVAVPQPPMESHIFLRECHTRFCRNDPLATPWAGASSPWVHTAKPISCGIPSSPPGQPIPAQGLFLSSSYPTEPEDQTSSRQESDRDEHKTTESRLPNELPSVTRRVWSCSGERPPCSPRSFPKTSQRPPMVRVAFLGATLGSRFCSLPDPVTQRGLALTRSQHGHVPAPGGDDSQLTCEESRREGKTRCECAGRAGRGGWVD